MKSENRVRIAGTVLGLAAVSMLLSGCLGSPTYGTDKTATEQLFDDLGAVASIRPQRDDIVYQPRPDIVKPASTATLPPPQVAVAGAGNPNWPESPEQTRDRIRAEAETAGPGQRSPLARRASGPGERQQLGGRGDGPPIPGSQSNQVAQQQYRQAQEVARGTNPNRRNFLSEPPVEYRQPASTAPVGDLGESERTKERERLEKAQRPGSRRFWPF